MESLRFFNNREVRTVWDDENNCWWFLADELVYIKGGNYYQHY